MSVTLNRSGLAKHMGKSLPTIDRWVQEGMPVVQRGGRGVEWIFDLPDVIRWYGERAAAQAAGDEPGDLDKINLRAAKAKMLQAELELAKAMGEVATIRDFERVQAAMNAEIRTNVMAVPQRVVIQLLGETDETKFKEVLRRELTGALQAAAEADLTVDEEADENAEAE